MSTSEGQVRQKSIELVPGSVSSYRNGWRQLRKYFLELLLIGIIATLISLPSGMTSLPVLILLVLGFVYSILIVGPVEYGASFAYLKAARGDKPEIKDLFEAFRNYWNAVLASVFVGVIVLIGIIAFIIPGIVFACRLAFTPYLVVDRKMQVIEAIKESWRMTNGHAWTIFFIGL